jgi:hypothetical protein
MSGSKPTRLLPELYLEQLARGLELLAIRSLLGELLRQQYQRLRRGTYLPTVSHSQHP